MGINAKSTKVTLTLGYYPFNILVHCTDQAKIFTIQRDYCLKNIFSFFISKNTVPQIKIVLLIRTEYNICNIIGFIAGAVIIIFIQLLFPSRLIHRALSS